MDSTIKKFEEIFGPRDWVLNAEEKSVVNSLHSYLEPFYKTTTNLCTCKLPTVGLVFFFMDHVFELIDPYKKERKKAGAKNQKQFARFQEKKSPETEHKCETQKHFFVSRSSAKGEFIFLGSSILSM